MKTIRNYLKLLNDLLNLNTLFALKIIGYINYDTEIYPMVMFSALSKFAKRNVVILSGTHGDEYFAVHVLLKWLQQIKLANYPAYNFYIFPVCNPYGYEKNYRDNGARQDTNNDRNFVKDSSVKELALLYENFPSTADIIIDIHGDTGKDKVYGYEKTKEFSILQSVFLKADLILSFLKTKTIYKMPLENGVVKTPKDDEGIEKVMEMLGTEYTITIELPGKCDGQKRTLGGIAILNNILKLYGEKI